MKAHIFYSKFANTPMKKRYKVLSNTDSILLGMTLNDVYDEISKIDDKLRKDEIRRYELLREVEKHLK